MVTQEQENVTPRTQGIGTSGGHRRCSCLLWMLQWVLGLTLLPLISRLLLLLALLLHMRREASNGRTVVAKLSCDSRMAGKRGKTAQPLQPGRQAGTLVQSCMARRFA